MCIAASMVLAVAGPLRAQVQVGRIDHQATPTRLKDLCVARGCSGAWQHGWPMKIVEAQPIPQTQGVHRGDEKYSGQVEAHARRVGSLNYVAGARSRKSTPTTSSRDQDHAQLQHAGDDRRPRSAQLRRRHRSDIGKSGRFRSSAIS